MKTICLNMIVKNEAHIIEETLNNILKNVPITYWVISDTGSTDNTMQIIQDYFNKKNITGELVQNEWKDFGYNRTKALEAAFNKTDYLLIFDADDKFLGDFKMPELKKDSYLLKLGGGVNYYRPLLINNRKRWCFKGVLHEYLQSLESNISQEHYEGNYFIISGKTGSRSNDPDKYLKDARILEKAFDDEPDRGLKSRYAFYCAQSYKDSNKIDESIQWYEKVLSLNNWVQEKYYSCLMLGQLYSRKNNFEKSQKYYLEAINYDNERIEGIVEACEYFLKNEQYLLINCLYHKYKNYNKNPLEKLFLFEDKYKNILEYYNSIAAFYVRDYNSGYECCKKILLENISPKYIIDLIYSIINHYDIKIDNEIFNATNKYLKSYSQINLDSFKLWEKTLDIEIITKYKKNKITNKLNPNVIITITTCKRLDLFKKTINSILNTWLDYDRIDYWFCVDDNSSEADKNEMKKSYNWIDYYFKNIDEKGHRKSMNIIWDKLNELKPKYWIHIEDDFLFFEKGSYVEKSIKYLNELKDKNIYQILFNRNYAETINDFAIIGHLPYNDDIVLHEHKSGTFNYSNCHYWPHYSFRPSMVIVEKILELGNFDSNNNFFERDYADRWNSKGFKSAFFNGIYCKHIGKLTSEHNKENAYILNNEEQFNNNKIKVLNLLRRPDRKINIEKEFKKQNISNYEFILAVDGNELFATEEIRKLFIGNDFNNRKGVIGCALSHYNLWKKLVDDNFDYYLIMEDDAALCNDFSKKLEKIKLKEYELIFFGYHMFEKNRKIVSKIYNIESDDIKIEKLHKNLFIGGTHCYSINKNGAKKLLNFIETNGIKHGIDYVMKIADKLNCYESQPHLSFAVWNENEIIDSDIQYDFNSLDLNENIRDKFDFIPMQDQIGNDLYYNWKSDEEMMLIALNDPSCAGFNTLGFFKSNINILSSSQYFKNGDGIFIKKNFLKHTIEEIYKNNKNIKNKIFIETGSYIGLGIEAALRLGFEEIHSIELSEKYYNICKERFKNNTNVHIHFGDSGIVLPEILQNTKSGITFWLDGHFSCLDTACATNYVSPIQKELDAIEKYYNSDHVILIDDIKDFNQESINWNNKINNKCGYITKKELEEKLINIFGKAITYYDGPACVSYKRKLKWYYFYTNDYEFYNQHLSKNKNFDLCPILINNLKLNTNGHHFNNITIKIELVINAIKENWNKYILFTDATLIITKSDELFDYLMHLTKKDIYFADNSIDNTVNIGFMLINCNSRTLKLWEDSLNLMKNKICNWDQQAVNMLISNINYELFDKSKICCGYDFNNEYIDTFYVFKSFIINKNDKYINFKARLDLFVKNNLISQDEYDKWINYKKVKLICDWDKSDNVCKEWQKYNNANIILTTENPDYYVIINKPLYNEFYDPKKTIIFQMEPWVYDENKNWGVKTWGEWAKPDESKFLCFYKKKNLFVNSLTGNIPQNKIDKIVSICSNKNQDIGHILRNNFIKYIENIIEIDIYGRENYHNFQSYIGKLLEDNRLNGYSKYKYCFSAENNSEIDYATEKIYEPIFCECLCFYWGCPNLDEFIDNRAFVQLDLNNFDESLRIIRKAIEEDWWSQRIDIIKKEKQRIIEELNFFKVLEKIIS